MTILRAVVAGAAACALVAYLVLIPVPALGVRMPALITALTMYLIAHALRALRIFLLLYDGRLRAGETLAAHFQATGLSLLIPWKLGEIYRIWVFDGITHNTKRVLMSVWVERIWDTGALLILLLLALMAGVAMKPAPGLVWSLGIFLVASAFLFMVLPENVNLVKRYLIVRQNDARALWILGWVDQLHVLLTTAYRLLRYRRATMLWITCGIWALELSALHLVDQGGGTEGVAQDLADQLNAPTPWQATSLGSLATYHVVSVKVLAGIALALLAAAALQRMARRQRQRQLLRLDASLQSRLINEG